MTEASGTVVPRTIDERRPGWVTASAVLLLIVAAISGLIGLGLVLLALVAGPSFAEFIGGVMPEIGADAVGGLITATMAVFGVVALVWAGGHTAAGIGILGGRGWARITGMVLAVIGLLLTALMLGGTLATIGETEAMMRDPFYADLYAGMTPEQVVTESIVGAVAFNGPFIAGYLVVLVTLIRSGRFFREPPPPGWDVPRAADA